MLASAGWKCRTTLDLVIRGGPHPTRVTDEHQQETVVPLEVLVIVEVGGDLAEGYVEGVTHASAIALNRAGVTTPAGGESCAFDAAGGGEEGAPGRSTGATPGRPHWRARSAPRIPQTAPTKATTNAPVTNPAHQSDRGHSHPGQTRRSEIGRPAAVQLPAEQIQGSGVLRRKFNDAPH